MDAASSFEILASLYLSSRHHTPMVNNLHIHPRGNPKPHVTIYWPVQAITRIFNLIISIRYIINICHHEVLTGFYLQLIFSVFIKSC